MDLVFLLNQIKMAAVIVGIIFCLVVILLAIRDKEFSDDIIKPWEQEERRAAKKAAKAKKKEDRRRAKYWREIEKQYR